jgi:predicted  nucleic acid-binding Zn-ribbon protein
MIMMKKMIAVALAAFMGTSLMAQSVQETTAMVGEKTVTAYTMSLEKNVDLVQDAMNQRLKDAKLKTKKSEGYVAALDQVFPELSEASMSLYTKVEEQGKRKKKVAVVTVCAISNDLTISQSVINGNVRNFVDDFGRYVARYEASQNMEAEQANLKKAEKAAGKAAAAVTDLENDITKAQKKIEDRRKDIEKYQQKIADCEKEIADLEKSIEKNSGKKVDAERKAEEANQNVKAAENEVEKYRQLSE